MIVGIRIRRAERNQRDLGDGGGGGDTPSFTVPVSF